MKSSASETMNWFILIHMTAVSSCSYIVLFIYCPVHILSCILFLSDEGPTLETLDYILSVLAVHQPFYISICIPSLPTQHTILFIYAWQGLSQGL